MKKVYITEFNNKKESSNQMNIVRYVIIFTLFTLTSVYLTLLHGQTSQKSDSLLRAVQDIQANHPNAAYQISLQLEKQINKNDHFEQVIGLYIDQAKILIQIGQEKEALLKLQKAERLLADQKNLSLETILEGEFVNYYISIRDKATARVHLNPFATMAHQLNDPKSTALALAYKGYFSSSPDSSIINYTEALRYSTVAKDTVLTGKIYADIGLVYYLKKGDLEKSIWNYEKSIELLEIINCKPGLVISYRRLSSVLRRQENYEKSITYNLKAIAAAEQSHFVRGMISAYANMGNAYAHLQRTQDGLTYRKRAANKAIEYKMFSSLPSIYNNIGSSFVVNNPDSALHYLELCVYYSTQINNLENLGTSKGNIAVVYQNKGEYSKAENYYKEALEALQKGSYLRHLSHMRTAFVEFYLQWSQESSELRRPVNYSAMQKILDSSAPNLIEQGEFKASELLYKSYIELYSAQQNIEQSNHYRAKLISLRDSLIINTNIASANEWAEKFKTVEKEKEIVLLEAKNNLAQLKNKYFTVALIGTVLFFCITGLLYRKYIRQRNEKLKIEEAQQFRSKLSSNLHDDVGSVLSNLSLQSQIASLSASAQQKEELDSIALMSQEAMYSLRDTVWAIDARKDKYENLIDRMVEYAERVLGYKGMSLELQKNKWNGQTAIDPEKRQNIYLVFKEAITNIIKHSTGSKVTVQLSQSKSQLSMSIHDNGSPDPQKVSDGSGLGNMKMRAQNIGGQLSTLHHDGFQVLLEVPI